MHAIVLQATSDCIAHYSNTKNHTEFSPAKKESYHATLSTA